MAQVRITAEPRTEFGKGGARRTRRAGKLPAVLYGHGTDPRHISLPARDFDHALRTDGANVLLDLAIGSDSELALPKSIQRDPVRGVIEHVDLILVRRGERISVDVPLLISGDLAPGGLLEQSASSLTVTAEATHIPTEFAVSVEGLEVGASVHAKDLDLPDGVEIDGDPEQVLLHVLPAPTAEQVDAELAEAEADLGAGAGAAATEEATSEGAGDVVPDTDSGEGGPAEDSTTAS